MAFDIQAIDNEFAISTGSNVNVAPGQSRFDNPPNSASNLVISTQEGDADPRLFEVGDTYDLSWNGNSISDATVVRSDAAPGGGGAIVFEGTDSYGNLAQVVWTPDFDLENWYWTNYNPSAEPQFYTSDQNASYTHEYICFERSTRLHTPAGLISVARLAVDDLVCTWSGQKARIRWIGRKKVPGQGRAAPVRFAPGSIGNFAPIKLSPQHRVMISSAWAELHFGSSEVLVPAVSLIDGKSVKQVARGQVEYVHILLDRHDILIAEGAPCESSLPGWRTRDFLSVSDRAAISAAVGDGVHHPARPILTRAEAELAVAQRAKPRSEMLSL